MSKLPNAMSRWGANLLRLLFVLIAAYPVVWLWLGILVRHRERLPSRGPAIIAANHNSHLDIMVLLSLFPLLRVPQVQAAAAADYFCQNWFIKWFSVHVIGIIPVVRGSLRPGPGAPDAPDPLEECYRALEAGKTLIFFPEGTRGQPGEMADLKAGVWHLARRFPEVPVIPVYLHGLGQALPRGAFIPVPRYVKVAVGQPLHACPDKLHFLQTLREKLVRLQHKVYTPIADDDE